MPPLQDSKGLNSSTFLSCPFTVTEISRVSNAGMQAHSLEVTDWKWRENHLNSTRLCVEKRNQLLPTSISVNQPLPNLLIVFFVLFKLPTHWAETVAS